MDPRIQESKKETPTIIPTLSGTISLTSLAENFADELATDEERAYANDTLMEVPIDDDNFGGTVVRTKTMQSPSKVTVEFYFDFVKSALTEIQQTELLGRLDKLTYVMELAHNNEQIALKEAVQRQIAVIVLQQEADIQGYHTYVTEEAIDKFKHQVEFKSPQLTTLKNFPRILPEDAAIELKKAKATKLFDSFWILAWNPKAEQLATVKDRVIKKDPILFGRFDFDPETYYYITDWVDETCDLTFTKMVDEIGQVIPNYTPGKVTPFEKPDLLHIVEIARRQRSLVSGTSMGRYRSDAIVAQLEEERFTWSSTGKLLRALWKQWTKKKKR